MIKTFEEFINESLNKSVEEVAELINNFCNSDGDEFGGKNILYIQTDVVGLNKFLNDAVVFYGQEIMDADRLCNVFKENIDKNIVLNDVNIIDIVKDSESLHIIKCAGTSNPERRIIVCGGEKFTFTGKLVIISATGKDELIRLGGYDGMPLVNRCYFA